MDKLQKPYIKALDALRVIAISAVVLVHITTRTIETTKDNLLGYSWTLFLNQIARFCVPLFFIVSGFGLELNYDYHTGLWGYLKKRASKILIPFIFWSTVYYLFIYNQNHDNFFWVLFTGNASYQLYFIPTLVIFYLIFPFLHRIYNVIANKWIFSLLLIIEVVLTYKDYYIREFAYPDPVHIALLAYIYFLIGMIAARNKDKIISFTKKFKYPFIFTSAVSGFYLFYEGFSRFLSTGNYLEFYSSWRVSTLIFTIAIGAIMFYFLDTSNLSFDFSKKLSNLSFFVFFVHVIILENAWNYFGHSLFNFMSQSFWGKMLFDPLFFAVVLSMSFFVAFIAHKIPYLKKITG